MKKIIVSHKRATRITTHKHVADCAVCVPEAQAEEYAYYNKGLEIIPHPDSVVGLSPKRQWILDNFEEAFQLDDDIIAAVRTYSPSGYHKPKRLTPEEISMWIDDLSEMARIIGAPLFGFNRSASPKAFSGSKPLTFNKYITGGAFGILKNENLFFPDFPHFVGEDYWISGVNAHFNRKSLIDERVSFYFEQTEANVGGVADYRTEDRRKETYLYLRKCFGNAIKPKKGTPAKRKIMKYEKKLEIPY